MKKNSGKDRMVGMVLPLRWTSLILMILFTEGCFVMGNDGNGKEFTIKNVEQIARVTGRSLPHEDLLNPNQTDRKWDVGGTDLGIIWELSDKHYGIFFGDTYGEDLIPQEISRFGPAGSNWRSNVLAFSDNRNLNKGIVFSSMVTDSLDRARQIIFSRHDTSNAGDYTSIPTAAVRVRGIDYVHYFNVRKWHPKMETNFSGLYKSMDNGKNWEAVNTIRFTSDSKFALAGYFEKEDFIYMMGTPAYRDHPAYLARFKGENVEDLSEYEYWNGAEGMWERGNESLATPIVNDKVGELSFIYNKTLKKWILSYFSEVRYNLTLRFADDITGPWSEPYELASGKEYPQLYGSYFHPLSASGKMLYFTMSRFGPYNVYLMKAELERKH